MSMEILPAMGGWVVGMDIGEGLPHSSAHFGIPRHNTNVWPPLFTLVGGLSKSINYEFCRFATIECMLHCSDLRKDQHCVP